MEEIMNVMQKRNPITKMTFLIRSDQQKELLARKIANLPIDSEKPIQIVISEEVKKRSIDANGLMWKRIGEIATQGWINKRQYSKECWHKYLKDNEMPEEVELKDGTICSKWVEQIDGSREVISTTKLSARCFSEYITIIEAFGSGIGVMFSANPREFLIVSKITDSAKGKECQVRIPGVCSGDNRTVVWAHAIGLASGRGLGIKALDLLGAYACQKCHDAYDRRIKPYGVLYHNVKECFYEGHLRSLVILIEDGLVKF